MLRLERLRDRAEWVYVVDRADEPTEADPDPGLLRLLRRALNELPDRERRAVELRYFEQMPALRIAVELGVTEGNARRVVFNGIQHLRSKLR
jgi:RNA polymerase sigma factor (sigma-70 family)